METSGGGRLSRVLLCAGALLGAAAAAKGVARPAERDVPMPAIAVARVNGTVIPRSRLAQARRQVAELAVRTGSPEPTDEVLIAGLVDEELMVQRAVELGLGGSDPRARAALVDALEALAIEAKVDLPPQTEAELRDPGHPRGEAERKLRRYVDDLRANAEIVRGAP